MNLRTAAIAFVLLLGSCATVPPTPANMPPRLTLAELGVTPGVEYSDVIAATGEATIASGPVANGDVVISFPYRYKHTAVLTEDVIGFSITVGGVQAPVGGPSDLWCFLPSLAGGEREHLCLLRNAGSLAAIAPTRMNPFLWRQFAPATGTFDYVHTPIFERRSVDIPGELVVEYRFERWGPSYVRLGEYAVGRQVGDLTIAVDGSGAARLNTVAGPVWISRVSGEEGQATVSGTEP